MVIYSHRYGNAVEPVGTIFADATLTGPAEQILAVLQPIAARRLLGSASLNVVVPVFPKAARREYKHLTTISGGKAFDAVNEIAFIARRLTPQQLEELRGVVAAFAALTIP